MIFCWSGGQNYSCHPAQASTSKATSSETFTKTHMNKWSQSSVLVTSEQVTGFQTHLASFWILCKGWYCWFVECERTSLLPPAKQAGQCIIKFSMEEELSRKSSEIELTITFIEYLSPGRHGTISNWGHWFETLGQNWLLWLFGGCYKVPYLS